MSVLVPTFPTSTNSHNHFHSNRHLSQSTNSGENEDDHVPFGVVNSMKQRLLDKVNESLLINNNSTFQRHSLSKTSARLSSNENLLEKKRSSSPIKRTTRLSRSQDNLLHNNNNNQTEQFSSYLQPKQDLIIVDTTLSNQENLPTHRHSYIELRVDEVPKPGTVTTVKKIFERQIRLSRYDNDKLTTNSRNNSQHKDISSPNRPRSISPNDMALRLRRSTTIPTTSSLLLPVSSQYPDLVISHTPPTLTNIEINKIHNEQLIINSYSENKTKDIPLNIITENSPMIDNHDDRSNLLLPSTSSSDIVDYQPLDFKSRLALFNRTNTVERSNEQLKKSSTSLSTGHFLTKPVVHHHLEKKEIFSEQISSTNAITYFGGAKINSNGKTILPITIDKEEQISSSTTVDLLRSPEFIGENVKLNKSSIFSGTKKIGRVQFIDNVDTFEYPAFHIVMAEFGQSLSDDDNDENDLETDNNNIDVDDDELDRLARLNANFNSSNRTEKPLQPKGSLHTFRPTHLDQYELGTQNDRLINSNSSDINSQKNYFSSLNNSLLKQEKSKFDMTNNIQWSSISTTTDLLF